MYSGNHRKYTITHLKIVGFCQTHIELMAHMVAIQA